MFWKLNFVRLFCRNFPMICFRKCWKCEKTFFSENFIFSQEYAFLNYIFSSSALDTAPLLILANKQDVSSCLPVLEIKHAFHDCSNRIGSRDCMIRPCSARTGAGVMEGIEWMAKCVKLNPYRIPKRDERR